MFKNETKQTVGKRAAGVTGLAMAAAIGVMSFGTHASAETFTLVSANMNQTWLADIYGDGRAYSNGVTFQVSGYNVPPTTSLFGFCIDIFHNMYLGNLGYNYTSNQDTGGGLVPNSGTVLNATQISQITNLVDTGWLLHQADPNGAITALKTAAIQAAIWAIEVPTISGHQTVTLVNGGSTVAGAGKTYQQFFDDYRTGNYTSLADANDRVFTISDVIVDNPLTGARSHQAFAVGWPIEGVPEPTSWALMLMGFFGLGSVVRNQRRQRAVATA